IEPDEPDPPLDQAADCPNLYDEGQLGVAFLLTTRRTNRRYLPMKYFEKVALAILLAATLSGLLGIRSAEAQNSSLNSELTRALEDLQNSDAAWRSEEAKYRQQRFSGGLSAEEASEYAEFVASLHRQKLENCETVRRLGGNKALTGL
ncbi:MAG: hypothetical protein ACKVH1_02275, partial [Alphaproteobacteria bacterium]